MQFWTPKSLFFDPCISPRKNYFKEKKFSYINLLIFILLMSTISPAPYHVKGLGQVSETQRIHYIGKTRLEAKKHIFHDCISQRNNYLKEIKIRDIKLLIFILLMSTISPGSCYVKGLDQVSEIRSRHYIGNAVLVAKKPIFDPCISPRNNYLKEINLWDINLLTFTLLLGTISPGPYR